MPLLVRAASLACAMIAVLGPSALAQKVSVEYDHQKSFASYHTYRWGKNKAQLPDAYDDAHIKSVVASQLQAKGLHLATSRQADLVVTYQATVQSQGQQVNTYTNDNLGLGVGPGWNWGWGPGWGWGWGDLGPTDSTTTISTIQRGDLLIDMVDTATKKIVFRGYATGAFKSNPIKEDELITRAVDKIFSKFPPKEK